MLEYTRRKFLNEEQQTVLPEKVQEMSSIDTDKPTVNVVDEKLIDPKPLPANIPAEQPQTPAYTAFSPGRRRFIFAVTTIAGFFGPLAGGIYLPALPVLEKDFHVSATAINVTVTVFMAVFAVGVSDI
jgi:hypothetical protein